MLKHEIKIGFIGTGFVSLLHKAAIEKIRNARLVGIYDKDQNVAKKREVEWGVKSFATIDELIHSPEIDAIFILTPVENHFEHAKKVMEAKKHLLIEKPVAVSVEEGRELARLAEIAGVICMPGHNYIYNPSIWRLKRMIDREEMGDIVAGWIHYCIGHSDEIFVRYPGVITQILSHHAYSLLYLLGRPKRLFAMATETRPNKTGKEDQSFITIEMPNGALVNLFVSIRTDDLTSVPGPFMIKILGTDGGGVHTWREGVNNKQVGTHPESWIPYDESYEFEVEHFVTCILGDKQPLSTIQDAVDTQIIIESAIKSVTDKTVIDIDWEIQSAKVQV